jgi:RNA polymerase sigma-70 factor (ECF subfamily)
LGREPLVDIYQDAVIILYQNVAEKKVDSLNSTLKTYLFGIAKHLIFRELKRQKSVPQRLDDIPEVAVAPHYLQQATEDHTQYQIRSALAQLGASCRQLIEYFYYYNFSMEVIAHRMRYKNANTVKAQKRRCMQQLEDLFKAKNHA